MTTDPQATNNASAGLSGGRTVASWRIFKITGNAELPQSATVGGRAMQVGYHNTRSAIQPYRVRSTIKISKIYSISNDLAWGHSKMVGGSTAAEKIIDYRSLSYFPRLQQRDDSNSFYDQSLVGGIA